jgi:hypothetical protein
VMVTWRMGWPCKQEQAGHQICIDDIRSALQTVTSRQHDPPRQRMKLFPNFLAGTPLLTAPAMPLCSPSPQRLQLPPSALLPHTPHLPQLQLLPTAWLRPAAICSGKAISSQLRLLLAHSWPQQMAPLKSTHVALQTTL